MEEPLEEVLLPPISQLERRTELQCFLSLLWVSHTPKQGSSPAGPSSFLPFGDRGPSSAVCSRLRDGPQGSSWGSATRPCSRVGQTSPRREARVRLLTEEFPELSIKSWGERGKGWAQKCSELSPTPNSLQSASCHSAGGRALPPQWAQDPSPPAPAKGGWRDPGRKWGRGGAAQVLSTPPPHWPPSSGPCPPEQQGMGPSL